MGSKLLLLSSCFLATTFLLLSPSDAQPALYTWCFFNGDANYTANSTFETNLNMLLTNLSSSTPSSSGFFATSSGSVPDRVNGLALCRGDTNSAACRSCLDNASQDIQQSCPYNRSPATWYDNCFLRYSNTRFAGTADYGNRVFMKNGNNISSSDAAQFNSSVLAVLRGLQSYAVSNATAPSLFAAGEMDIGGLGGYEKLYGLVQCSRDLTAGDCSTCLEEIFKDFPSCCPDAIGGRVLAGSCNFRYEVYSFYNWSRKIVFPRLQPPAPAPAPTSPSPSPSSLPPPGNETLPAPPGKKNNSTGLVLAITIPAVVIVVLIISIGWFCLCRKRITKLQSDDGLHDTATTESLLFGPAVVRRATGNFSDKLGEGAFGAVYKGVLPNGQEIAVKRILRGSLQGVEQLKNEIALLAKLQHRNLVRLLGVCLDGDENLLICEFVANKSLDIILFDPARKEQLDWEARYKIISGIARGLLYLHEESQVTIIHRDLKASNILLDSQLNPKISDFGTARLFVGDQTQASTNTVIGTFGYMSPEYVTRGHFSHKSDVYSFGVLVLEIITGRKCSDFFNSGNSESSTDLLGYVWEQWSNGSIARIVDPSLRGNYRNDEAQRCIKMALLCVQDLPNERPMMSSIALMLNSSSVSMQVPMMPAFARDYSKMSSMKQQERIDDASNVVSEGSTIKSEANTPNDMSITELVPR